VNQVPPRTAPFRPLAILSALLLSLSNFSDLRATQPASSPASASDSQITDPKELDNGDVVSSLVTKNGTNYKLLYEKNRGLIEIEHSSNKVVVQKIPAGHDPSLIGEEKRVRFLPADLQPYLSQGNVLLVTVTRTNGGDGGGQCGSGAEVYLKVLDIRANTPKIIASHLIESCDQSIDLTSDGNDVNKFSAFSVENGGIKLSFLSYKDLPGDITAKLSDDLSHLMVKNTGN
jgi:hypothetical protein